MAALTPPPQPSEDDYYGDEDEYEDEDEDEEDEDEGEEDYWNMKY